MNKVGIIGFGAFGQFMAKHLMPYFDITVTDVRDVSKEADEIGVKFGSMDEVASMPALILAVPVTVLEKTLTDIADLVRDDAVVFDVCSVKVKPRDWMIDYLPESVSIVATHPVFGPKSGRNGIEGLKMMVSLVRGDRTSFDRLIDFLSEDLGVDVLECSCEEHDREMAYVQALTHLLGRSLNEFEMPDLNLTSSAFSHLIGIRDLLSLDSDDLFLTIQRYNPYAKEVREKFLGKLNDIEKFIEE